MTETTDIIKQLPKPFPNPATMFQSGPRAVEMGQRGGSVTGPTKSLGQHLRWLKQKGLTDEKSQELFKILTDPTVSALDARLLVEQAKVIANKEKTMKNTETAARLSNEWHKMHHVKTEAPKIEMNIGDKTTYEFVIIHKSLETKKEDNIVDVEAIKKE